jgi:hypothetical protein
VADVTLVAWVVSSSRTMLGLTLDTTSDSLVVENRQDFRASSR